MKKLLLVCLMTLFCTNIWAIYDFTALNDDGVTIYYSYIDVDTKTVEVSHQYSDKDANTATTSYVGDLVIPSEVKDDSGETYTVVGLGYKSLAYCEMTSLSLPSTLTTIEERAFMNVKIAKVDIPEGVTTMGEDVFYNSTSIVNVTLPSTLKTIPKECFRGCTALENCTMPEGIETLDGSVFYGCTALSEVVFPNSVTTLAASVFQNAGKSSDLTLGVQKIVFGTGLTSFSGTGIFTGCYGLKSVYFRNPEPPTHSGTEFTMSGAHETIYAPIGALSAYQTSFSGDASAISGFAEFAEIDIVVPDTDSEDDGYATFYHGTYDITLPEGVQAWYASDVENGEVTLTKVENTIPAGNAVLVEGNIADYYMDATAATSETTLEGNMLYGSDEDTTTSVNNVTDGYYFYKLSTLEGENLGFYWGAVDGGAFEIAANKAWLAVPTTNGARALSFKKGESDTTGITTLPTTTEATTVNGIYTLQGVRVSDMNQKGVYIVNGKKVLVK